MAQFASADELAAVLSLGGQPVTFTPSEATAADLILSGVSAAVQRHTGQIVEKVVDDTVVLQGNWSRELQLPQWPVVSVSAVKVNGAPVATGTWYLAAGKLYRGYLPVFNGPDDWGGDLFLSSWLGPISTVEVTYTHGFDPIPDDLRLFAVRVAARLLDNPEGATSLKLGIYEERQAATAGLLTEAEKAEVDWLRNHL